MMIDNAAKALVDALRARSMTLATAESCTGGGIGHALTSVPGSSAVYLGGVISYANDVKEKVLSVPGNMLAQFGAVSEETARAMAVGAKKLISADIAVSVTGIAGPASDYTNKPVGLVYIAIATNAGVTVKENHFTGDRDAIRAQTIQAAIEMVFNNI